MYILGINTGHDSSACLLRDGTLLAFVEEERFTRVKHWAGFPFRSVEYCLEAGGITLADVDKAAVSNLPPFRGYAAYLTDYVCRGLFLRDRLDMIRNYLRPPAEAMGPGKEFRTAGKTHLRRMGFPAERIEYVEHHLSHAASAFRCSPFRRSAIITLDALGDNYSGSVSIGEESGIAMVRRIKAPNSLGFLYTHFTRYLGYRGVGHESKVMGMAAYGKPTIGLSDLVTYDKDGLYRTATRYVYGPRVLQAITERMGKPPLTDFFDAVPPFYCDVAASLQALLEEAARRMVAYATQTAGSRNLSLAGGVGFNCKMNGELLRSGMVDGIFIQPAAGDAGRSLGAALEVLSRESRARIDFSHAYWGPDYTGEEIAAALRRHGMRFEAHEDIAGAAADLLAKGKVIGWFQGRMESGPRALGNRSILADPSRPGMWRKVNEIKGRERWRPLAPSLLERAMPEYFGTKAKSPFMILAFWVLPEKRREIPSAVHHDGSSRPQTVAKKTNPRYHRLISEFEKQRGIPVVLNTSFNYREPIVCSPEDAIRTFSSTGLDALAIGDFLVRK